MIVRISATQKTASLVDVQSCVFGVDSEIIEAIDPNDIKIQLTGDPMKIAHVVGRTGSKIVSIVNEVRV